MNEETLFEQARQLPLAERAAFLERECDDPQLRRRVLRLLEADAQSHSPIDLQATNLAATSDSNPASCNETFQIAAQAESIGTMIQGRYKLLQQIGEGGMGTVWMAEQTEPVKRRVAVKLIRVDRSSSKAVLARFEAERQAIALMDHPNIAKLLDAGTTENGSPYFVMELVKGVPLDEFCDRQRLGIRERLELFISICEAIQHAHQKGIIHRDLKPSNVLVESHDGKPVPKIIDFGLAKAVSGISLTDHTLFTAFGSVLGTPLYMAPEQATFNAVDIDTRADVYALGVILYELLTGTTPITRDTLKQAALEELFRLIREQEAPTPSSRLSLSESSPNVAANRQITPDKLGRLVRGDLDWIVLKALSKERERRYESVIGFARDIERFLNHEPVTASPPSRLYKLRKFVRRHRLQVTAATLVLLALIAGVIGTSWGMVRANRAAVAERNAKIEAEASATREREAKEVSLAQLEQITLINNTVFDIFKEFDIRKVKQGRDPVEVVLANKLIEAGRKLDSKSIPDPLVLADLRNRLGTTLYGLGKSAEAAEFLEEARSLRIEHLGSAEKMTLVAANDLGLAYQGAGKFKEALAILEETAEQFKKTRGPHDRETLSALNNLAETYRRAGQRDKAIPIQQELLQKLKATLPASEERLLLAMNNLAASLYDNRQTEQAGELFAETLELMKVHLGPDHPHTLSCAGSLANCYRLQARFDEAIALMEDLLERSISALGLDHPVTLGTMNNLGTTLANANRFEESIKILEKALERREAALGRNHPSTTLTMSNLANSYRSAGQLDRAITLLEDALQLQLGKLDPEHPDVLVYKSSLAKAYADAGRSEPAATLYKQVISARRKTANVESPTFAGTLAIVGSDLLDLKMYVDAEAMLRECWEIRQKIQPDEWTTFNIQSAYGGALLGQQKFAEAEPMLLAGYQGLKDREASIPEGSAERLLEARARLVELYIATDRAAEAEKYRD